MSLKDTNNKIQILYLKDLNVKSIPGDNLKCEIN